MKIQKLEAFHGNNSEKEACLRETYLWIEKSKKPKSTWEIVSAINSQYRIQAPAGCLLEDFNNYVINLGLPLWIGHLMSIINHHNSTEFNSSDNNYEEQFYPKFISACKTGKDYSLMFHQWEIFLLSEMLPENERQKHYFLELIEMHKDSLLGNLQDINKWVKMFEELDSVMNHIHSEKNVPKEFLEKQSKAYLEAEKARLDKSEEFLTLLKQAQAIESINNSYKEIAWSSARVAYLSVSEYIYPDKFYTCSAEALVDSIWYKSLISGENIGTQNEIEFKKNVWNSLMIKLIEMIQNWS